jgi:hypothetical protein
MEAETSIERDEAVPERDERTRLPDMPGAEPASRPAQELRGAMRTARIEDAERSRAIADLRGAELARLDLLREAIEPVLAQVPGDVEMFDAGLIPVPQPRLFIDMIAFVEMAHDKRRYRFVQDTRQGRVVLAESDRLETMRDAVTSYIARRLVEREKALAVDAPRPISDARVSAARAAATAERRRRSWVRTAGRVVLNYLGIVALCVLVWVAGWIAYRYFAGLPN